VVKIKEVNESARRITMSRDFLSTVCCFFIITCLCSQTLRAQTSEGTTALTAHQKLARGIFRELIETNTTMNIGSGKAAEAIALRLKAAGFSDNDIQLAGPRAQNMNLIVRYRGKGALRPVLFFGHLDVVEALRQDWSSDPFVFLEKDGYFYGRGTSDMKNEDADIVANLIRLKSEGFEPDRDIIVALTEHEEGGDANGINWLLTNRRDLIDAEFAINLEGGGGEIKNGKYLLMKIQTGEKIYVNFQLEIKNKGGHSSLPVKNNAIYQLAAGLSRLAQYEFPIRMNETTRTFFQRAASQENGQAAADMQAILKIPMDTSASNRLCASSAYYNALLRTTCVATMLSAGHAMNALPQTARAVVNCRMLPDDSLENVFSTLTRVLADSQIVVSQINQIIVSPLSPLRKEVMDKVEKLTTSMWPGVIVTPVMSTGASDGRYLRKAGIPVYGVSGNFEDVNDIRAHGRDERLGVQDFYNGVEFMYRFIKALASGS
jgi:acetylornithine deacetylase/succinyl-diaminopimelate desuccinylase-like protein